MLGLIEWLAVEPVLGPSHVLRNGDVVHGWPIKPFRIYYQRDSASFRVVRIYHEARAHHALTTVPSPSASQMQNSSRCSVCPTTY